MTCDLVNQQKDNDSKKTMTKTILEFCDIWDADYNYDDWDPLFMTIFVTIKLIVALDSIRNSSDVF